MNTLVVNQRGLSQLLSWYLASFSVLQDAAGCCWFSSYSSQVITNN